MNQTPPQAPAPDPGANAPAPVAPSPPLPWSPRKPLSRRELRALADQIRQQGLDVNRHLHQLFDEQGAQAAARFALGAIMAGQPPDAREVTRILPTVQDEDVMLPALAFHASGDRLAALFDLVESDTMYYARSFMCLYLIFEILGEERPPRLLSLLRYYARKCGHDALLGHLISRVSDPAVRRIGAPHLRWLSRCGFWLQKTQTRLAQIMKDPLSFLPEEDTRRVSGFTVTRPRSIGRNDPCPCQSGKKYKKCCQPRDEENPPEPSPVAGLTRAEYRARISEFLSEKQFAELNLSEMLESPTDRLPLAYQIVVLRECALWGHWELAERIMAVIDSPAADVEQVEDARVELVQQALSAKQMATVARQFPLVKHPLKLGVLPLTIAHLMLPSQKTMNIIENYLRLALAAPDHVALASTATLVAEHYPALGILLCRGSLLPMGDHCTQLLQQIEEARDRLNLPPDDIYGVMCTAISDADRVDREHAAAHERVLQEGQRLQAREAEIGEQVRKAEARAEDLALKLQKTTEALAAARTALMQGVDPQEHARLQRKVDRLRERIQKEQAEREELQAALAAVSKKATRAAAEPPPVEARPERDAMAPAQADADADGDEPGEAPEEARRQVLPPVMSRQVRASLRDLPVRVAQEALLTMARLGGGDPAAWDECKRLTQMSLWSVRVARRYRLLFRPAEGYLEILDLRHRRNLDISKRHLRGHTPETMRLGRTPEPR